MNRTFLHAIPFAFLALFCVASAAHAESYPLLNKAVANWDAGRKDLAFTQHSKSFGEKGEVIDTRVERYDPSLPDNQRWRLIELNGKQPTDAERQKWESKKNGKPRRKGGKPVSEYLDLGHAKMKDENEKSARFEVGLRPEAARLVAVEQLSVILTIDKSQAEVTHISAMLREPMKIALGLAKVTDLDFDLHVDPDSDKNGKESGEVKPESTAKVVMSKFGDPIEYRWSDFKRVTAYGSAK